MATGMDAADAGTLGPDGRFCGNRRQITTDARWASSAPAEARICVAESSGLARTAGKSAAKSGGLGDAGGGGKSSSVVTFQAFSRAAPSGEACNAGRDLEPPSGR